MVEYPTQFKNIYCETCLMITTHISEHGNNFKCLACEAKAIRKITSDEPVYYPFPPTFLRR